MGISRRGLLVGGVALAAGFLGSRWAAGDLPLWRPWQWQGRQSEALPARISDRAQVPYASSFVVGANYEGPADRAWQMWAPDCFDAALIDADFARAADIGLDTLRIFVQEPLAEQINHAEWWRLDTVLELAERRGVSLLITMSDFPESDLWGRAVIAGAVAHRYANRTGVAGYDLKNEPQIGDLITALFPRTDRLNQDAWRNPGIGSGAEHPRTFKPAIQTNAVIQHYGEIIPRENATAWRAMRPDWLPARLTDDEAYWAINALLAVDIFQSEYRAWTANFHGTTVMDYIDQPEHLERWGRLVDLLDSALGYWIDAQAAPLWLEDQTAPVTVGYNDLVLASRPANRSLDAVSFHQYQAALDEAPAYSASVLSQIAQRAGRPAVLGEFGWSTHEVHPPRAAELEAATFAAARAAGLMGGYKWMLNDAANQPNPREAEFGMFRADGSAKPSAMAVRDLALA
jgi:hypothetical protein